MVCSRHGKLQHKKVDKEMARPFPLRFELPSPARCLRVERVDIISTQWGKKELLEQHYWRLWLMANGDFTLGTFIQLLDNGKVNRITWHENGSETIFEVRDG